MKTKMMNLTATALLTLSSFTATAEDSLIQILSDEGTATPFVDEQGNEMTATIVAIRQIDEVTLQVEPVEVTEDGIRAHSTLSVRLSAPQILSASWGVVFGAKNCEVHNNTKNHCQLDGFLVQIEPGLGGLKGSVGIARISTNSSPEPLRDMLDLPISALDLKASVFRTWDLSTLATTGPFSASAQTYAGVEADVNVSLIKFSLGLLNKLNGEGPNLMLTGGVGYGF